MMILKLTDSIATILIRNKETGYVESMTSFYDQKQPDDSMIAFEFDVFTGLAELGMVHGKHTWVASSLGLFLVTAIEMVTDGSHLHSLIKQDNHA